MMEGSLYITEDNHYVTSSEYCKYLIGIIIEFVYNSTSERERKILKYLSKCNSYQDYISNIQKQTGFPYTTVSRCLENLVEIKIVKRLEKRLNKFQYYKLTTNGIILIEIMTKNKKKRVDMNESTLLFFVVSIRESRPGPKP